MVQKQWYTFGNWPCDQIRCSNYDEFNELVFKSEEIQNLSL